MKAGRRKAIVSSLFEARFKGPPIWRSAEDRAWDNMAPVGREFGSPDFDRLMREDYENRAGVFSEDLPKQYEARHED